MFLELSLFVGQPLTEAVLWSRGYYEYWGEQEAQEPCSQVTQSWMGDTLVASELQFNPETEMAIALQKQWKTLSYSMTSGGGKTG